MTELPFDDKVSWNVWYAQNAMRFVQAISFDKKNEVDKDTLFLIKSNVSLISSIMNRIDGLEEERDPNVSIALVEECFADLEEALVLVQLSLSEPILRNQDNIDKVTNQLLSNAEENPAP